MWYASSCSGTTASAGESSSLVAGMRITSSTYCVISSSPSVASAMTMPARARTSWMFESIFL